MYYQTAAGILDITFDGEKISATQFIPQTSNPVTQEFDFKPEHLSFQGTPFQIKVWKATCKIPVGKTVTYKQLAHAIGQPKAYRAVANALGANKIAYFIPCHRVIRNDGKLGGYFWGIAVKAQLLESEGVKIAHRN